MKSNTKSFVAIVGVGIGLMMQMNTAFADSDSDSFKMLSAQWWQWALSIPISENPQLDNTGEKCIVGQRGSVWFLAGVFGGGKATRICSVPEGKALFFPIANSMNFNTPNVCGQGLENIPVEDLRAFSASFIDGITKVSVELDGKSEGNVRRVQSKVFEVALPGDNVFDPLCSPDFDVPSGIFSPAVDDGYYVGFKPLKVGAHTLHLRAETDAGVAQDVTYNLTVVPVLKK
jgi:hypothetical protein